MTRVLPTGWEKLKVRDVSKIYLGLTHTPQYIDNGIPFLSVKNISAGKIDFKDTKFISKEEFNSLPDGAKPQKGDVLFARVGTLGCPSIVDTEQPFGTFVSLGFFRVNKNKILNTYIRYWMMSPSFWEQVNINVQGSTLKNLNTGWLKNFEINVPSLPEQKRIVEKLDKIFADIDKAKSQTEKNLQNAKDVFSSYLNNIFNHPAHNWEEKKMGELCDVLDFRRKPITRKDRTRGLYPYYGATGIVDFIDSFLFDEPLLLVGEDGARWGSGEPCAFIASGKYWVNNHAHVLKPKNCMSMQYLVYFLNYSDLTPYITGTTVLKLNQQKLRSISVPSPSLPEQKRIVEKLDVLQSKTQELEKIYTQKLKDLEELKQAVLQQAFSGKL